MIFGLSTNDFVAPLPVFEKAGLTFGSARGAVGAGAWDVDRGRHQVVRVALRGLLHTAAAAALSLAPTTETTIVEEETAWYENLARPCTT